MYSNRFRFENGFLLHFFAHFFQRFPLIQALKGFLGKAFSVHIFIIYFHYKIR